jgi:hypothetical protein
MAQIDTLTNVGAVVSTDLALILRGGANVLGTFGSLVGQNSTAVSITGGTINGTAIGATTPATVAATTLSTTGAATIEGLTVGRGAGAVDTNTAVGLSAFGTNTTGFRNTAIGNNTLYSNTIGANNTAHGRQALYSNTEGSYNTANGNNVLFSNTTASSNTAVGYQALYTNTTGSDHTIVGARAGEAVTTGSGNTFLGRYAGFATTTGHSNVFIGYRTNGEFGAGHLVTTGSKNTIIGAYNGNQGGLDIRTASNHIVLSDGDGNPRAYWNAAGALTTTGAATFGGNVGIGTSSPIGRLEAVGGTGGGFNGWFRTGDTTAANNAGGGFYNTSSATATSRRAIMALDADGANLGGGDYFTIEKSGNSGTVDLLQYSNAAMRFGTDFLNRTTYDMTLDASGNMLVGTTAVTTFSGVSAAQNFVTPTNGSWAAGFRHSTNATPWGLAVEYSGAAPNNTSSNFIYCTDSTPQLRFSVRSNGGVENYQANDVNLSDRREKTNFSPSKSYLDVICSIPVQTFNYIDQNMEDDPGLTLGVVAQDVQAVAPEFVMESNWGTEEDPKMRLSLYQTDLQYALMKCIQEQQDMITSLTARLEALEGAK